MKRRMTDDQLEAYIDLCTTIEPVTINEEYVRVSSDLAFWQARFVEALDEESRAENLRKDLEGQLYLELRSGKAKGETEAMIGIRIRLDSRVQAARERQRQAVVSKSRALGVIESIRAKKEMLISLGANLRQEAEASIRRRDVT